MEFIALGWRMEVLSWLMLGLIVVECWSRERMFKMFVPSSLKLSSPSSCPLLSVTVRWKHFIMEHVQGLGRSEVYLILDRLY